MTHVRASRFVCDNKKGTQTMDVVLVETEDGVENHISYESFFSLFGLKIKPGEEIAFETVPARRIRERDCRVPR